MPGWLSKLFGGGGKNIIESVGGVLDNLITNKEELAKVKLEMEKEINRHMETMQLDATRQFELEVQDRSSARGREAEFVKATGHIDYLMWVLAISGIGIFAFMVYAVMTNKIPDDSRELVFHIFGLVEGSMLVNIYNYYFGSSAGSRIKDMKR